MSDRDRPKKSWREIDASRDKSRGGGRPAGPDRGAGRSDRAERSSKSYRAALDALFAKGEVGKLAEKLGAPLPRSSSGSSRGLTGGAILSPPPSGRAPEPAVPAPAPPPAPEPEAKAEDPRATLRKKLLAAVGRAEISRLFDRYVKAYGMPQDFELLEQALDHPRPERLGEVMVALDELLGREKPRRSRTLAGKLRLIEETGDEPDLRARAAALRARL